MKKSVYILAFTTFCLFAHAQDRIPLSLISSSGGTEQITNNGNIGNITWSIGETFIGGGIAGTQSISIGEQQGLPDITSTGISPVVFNNVKVYPNPASSYIRIENLPEGNKTIRLTDITGKTLQVSATSATEKVISTTNLATGVYNLILGMETMEQSSFKIIITNH